MDVKARNMLNRELCTPMGKTCLQTVTLLVHGSIQAQGDNSNVLYSVEAVASELSQFRQQ